MAGRRRLRRMDIVGLVGLVLLLVWTPLYVAQGEAERAVLQEDGFTLPPAREGSRMVLDLVVQWADEPAVAVPWVTVGHSATGDGGWVETRTHHPVELVLGPLSVAQDPRVVRDTYNATGHHIARLVDGPETGEGGTFYYRGPVTGGSPTDLERFAAVSIDRADSVVSAALKVATRVPNTDPNDGKAQRAASTVSRAVAAYNGTEVYAGDAAALRRFADGLWPDFVPRRNADEPGYCTEAPVDAFTDLWPRPRQASLDLVLADCRFYRWSWYHPEWPSIVGFHREVLDLEGRPVLTLDLLPAELDRGEGEVFPYAAPEEMFTRGWPRHDEHAVPLEEAQRDGTPLVHNVSLATARAMLAQDRSSSLLPDLVAHGGLVSAFSWVLADASAAWRFTVVNETIVASVEAESTSDGRLVVRNVTVSDAVRQPRADDSVALPSTLLRAVDEQAVGWAGGGPAAKLVALSWYEPPPVELVAPYPVSRAAHFATLSLPDRLDEPLYVGCLYWGAECGAWSSQLPRNEPLAAQQVEGPEYITPVDWSLGAAGGALVFGALLARLAAALWAGKHWAGVAWLYAKIAPEKVLDNGRRQEIMALVEADPGVTVSQLHRRLRFGWGATVHHLHRLEREGLLATVPLGSQRHLFPRALQPPERRVALAVARTPEFTVLLDALRERPGLGVPDLVAATSRSKPSVHRALRRLVGLGLVHRERAGRGVRYRPAAVLTALDA